MSRAFIITAAMISAAISSSCTQGTGRFDYQQADYQQVDYQSLPEACRTECVTPYAQVLGSSQGEVVAYSNCSDRCVVFTPNKHEGTFTGMRWQCVEFARRWLLVNKGVVYGDVDNASDIWNDIHHFTSITDNRKIPVSTYENGSTEAPRAGDLLIYSKTYLGTGHVAVITSVDVDTGVLKLAEQNYANAAWPGDFSRQLALTVTDGDHWVQDPYVLGWKRMSGED